MKKLTLLAASVAATTFTFVGIPATVGLQLDKWGGMHVNEMAESVGFRIVGREYERNLFSSSSTYTVVSPNHIGCLNDCPTIDIVMTIAHGPINWVEGPLKHFPKLAWVVGDMDVNGLAQAQLDPPMPAIDITAEVSWNGDTRLNLTQNPSVHKYESPEGMKFLQNGRFRARFGFDAWAQVWTGKINFSELAMYDHSGNELRVVDLESDVELRTRETGGYIGSYEQKVGKIDVSVAKPDAVEPVEFKATNVSVAGNAVLSSEGFANTSGRLSVHDLNWEGRDFGSGEMDLGMNLGSSTNSDGLMENVNLDLNNMQMMTPTGALFGNLNMNWGKKDAAATEKSLDLTLDAEVSNDIALNILDSDATIEQLVDYEMIEETEEWAGYKVEMEYSDGQIKMNDIDVESADIFATNN